MSESVFDSFENEGGFFRNIPLLFFLSFSLLLNIASYSILFFFIGERDTPIVLHYNVYFGIDALGVWWEAYFVPFVGTLFFFVHVFLGKYLFDFRETMLSFAVIIGLFFLECMIGIASVSLVLANY